ncbi:S8 family serine peptidase [Actinomycetes bacterium KLBMP 9797]
MRLLALLAVVCGVVALPAPAMAAPNGWELAAMSVPAAQKISKGAGVTVAVIDSGIRTDHAALKGRATEGPDFLGENDQNASYYGDHGTAMASNVLDVAPAAKVLGLRASRDTEDPEFDSWLGSMRDENRKGGMAGAIQAAVKSGAQVISLSLGSELGIYSSEEAAVIAQALAAGVVVVASAGNEGDEVNELSYPAAYPGVIAVGASTPQGRRATFSQVHNYVDVAAPGVEINAASIKGGRAKIQGTSPAGALTAGVAALVVAKYPDLSPRQVEQVLQRTASTYRKGHNPQTGYGVVNADAALKAAARLKPESAALPVGAQGVGSHFGPGDDGTPAKIGQPWDAAYLVVGGISAGIALFCLAVGLLLVLSGRRAAARTRPSP